MDEWRGAPGRVRGKPELDQTANGLRPAGPVGAIAPPKIYLLQQDRVQPDLNLFAPAGGRPSPLLSPFHDPAPNATDHLLVPENIFQGNRNFAGT
jgi:hypothetical protein